MEEYLTVFNDINRLLYKNERRFGEDNFNMQLQNLHNHRSDEHLEYLKNLKKELETTLKNGTALKQKETKQRKIVEKRQREVDFVQAVENNKNNFHKNKNKE